MGLTKEECDVMISQLKQRCSQNTNGHENNHKCKSCHCKPSFPVANLQFTQHSVTGALGVTLNAQTYSTGTGGLDLLFLHGIPLDFMIWANVVTSKKLLKHFNVHTMQLRGQGAGPFPDPFGPQGGYMSAETWSDDINAVINQLGMTPGNVVLIGHSYGGVVVADYIRKYGQSALKGIVLVGALAEPGTTPFGTTELNPPFEADTVKLLTDGMVQDSNGFQTFVSQTQKIFTNPKTQYFTTCAPDVNAGANLAIDAGVIRPQPYLINTIIAISIHEPTLNLSPIGPPSITDINTGVWPFVTVPTLIMQGTNDNVVKPNVAAPAIHAAIPNSKLKYFKCGGHLLWIDQPEKFNCTLYHFLRKL